VLYTIVLTKHELIMIDGLEKVPEAFEDEVDDESDDDTASTASTTSSAARYRNRFRKAHGPIYFLDEVPVGDNRV
jgi:hypothetical protein